MLLVSYRLNWTPEPLPASSPPELFSEDRAREHINYLGRDIGDHQVKIRRSSSDLWM
jgi:hypothetical protein